MTVSGLASCSSCREDQAVLARCGVAMKYSIMAISSGTRGALRRPKSSDALPETTLSRCRNWCASSDSGSTFEGKNYLRRSIDKLTFDRDAKNQVRAESARVVSQRQFRVGL